MKNLLLALSIWTIVVQKVTSIGGECAKLTEGNFFDIGPLKTTR
jgi:hypothetical protein